MRKGDLNYPYPLLRTECIDYKKSKIDSTLSVNITEKSYIVEFHISTNNEKINSMLENEELRVGILVESKILWYRKFFDSLGENIVEIPAQDVYGHVKFTVCIVAAKDIDNFYIDDFVSDYDGIECFKINRGEVIGIGQEVYIDAVIENDIFKNVSNIFNFVKTDGEFVNYSSTGDIIIIYLPVDMYEKYYSISRGYKMLNPLINSLLIIPVLVDILNQFDTYIDSNKKWYLTLKDRIEKKKIKLNDDEGFSNNALEVAQILTDDLFKESLLCINKIINDSGDE